MDGRVEGPAYDAAGYGLHCCFYLVLIWISSFDTSGILFGRGWEVLVLGGEGELTLAEAAEAWDWRGC